MKEKTEKLRKLMELDNPNADEYLSSFADDLISEIMNSKDNDYIFERLELLSVFVYKVPKKTIDIIKFIINNKSQKTKTIKTKFGNFNGKSHKDLILKNLELLNNIRYIVPDDVLFLILKIFLFEDNEIKNKALNVAKNIAKYDYNVLAKSNIGYGPQKKILDFMVSWPFEERLQYLDFIEATTKELLNLSLEGSEMTDVDTMTLHFGTVLPNDTLIEIRRKTVDFVYDVYQTVENPIKKLEFVKILGEALSKPHRVNYDDDFIKMILEDQKYLVKLYRKIVFGESGNELIEDLTIAMEIEKRLYWISKIDEFTIDEINTLRQEILKDNRFKLFNLLVGDLLHYDEDKDLDVIEKERSEKINKLIFTIEHTQFGEWSYKLNKIASQLNLIDEWQFGPFKRFLQKLTIKKPQLSDHLLSEAFIENFPLILFTSDFLCGFRISKQNKLWDKYVKKIVEKKEFQLVTAIIVSLQLPQETDLSKNMRKKDITLLENIVRKKDSFDFLRKLDDINLHYSLIVTLSRLYKYNPGKFEKLILEEIEINSEHLGMYIKQLPFFINRKWIEIKDFEKSTITFLLSKIIKISDIDWHIQKILIEIGKREGLQKIMDLFMNRILVDIKNKTEQKHHDNENYEVIPYHFNPEFCNFIAQHPDYNKIACKWVEKMTSTNSIYNIQISHFLQRIGTGFDEILMTVIDKGDDDSLKKAALAMRSIDEVDFNLCIEIVRRTDNEEILNIVRGNMYSTGIVSGEYGIANAYESKSRTLEKFRKSDIKRIREFAKGMISSFKVSALAERKRADEDKKLRQIEFEG